MNYPISWCFPSFDYFALNTYGFTDIWLKNFPKLHENPRYVVPKYIQTMALHIQKLTITLLLFFIEPFKKKNKTMKAHISIWNKWIIRVEIIFMNLNIMIWKWHYQKNPMRLILVIQFTYKGWINNNKKLWSHFNEIKAEK